MQPKAIARFTVEKTKMDPKYESGTTINRLILNKQKELWKTKNCIRC